MIDLNKSEERTQIWQKEGNSYTQMKGWDYDLPQ